MKLTNECTLSSRRSVTSVLAYLAFAGSILCNGTVSRADDRSDIEALYNKLERAQKTQSADATLALLAPTFHYTAKNGKVLNGKQFVQQMTNDRSKGVSISEFKVKVTNCAVKGNAATVTNSFAWSMNIKDRNGSPHILASTGKVTNELSRTQSGWRFVTLQTVDGNMTLDGKPMGSKPKK